MQSTADEGYRRTLVEQSRTYLDDIARLERMTPKELRATFDPEPEVKAARAEAVAETRRLASTPEAMQARRESIQAQVMAESAERQRLVDIEAEIQEARKRAADKAEAALRAKRGI
jgi:hypothetical protein